MIRLKELYKKEIIPKMKQKFNLKNDLGVPKISKVVISIGTGAALSDGKLMDEIKQNISLISGQKPVELKAKKAISGFKIRKGQVVGLKVTLREVRMYHFLDKMINIAMPRTKDFKGLSASFDGNGNITIGIKEHIVFPEIDESVEKIHGFEVVINTTTKNNEQAKELLTLFGFRFSASAKGYGGFAETLSKGGKE